MRQFNEQMLRIFDEFYKNIFEKIILNLLKFNSISNTENENVNENEDGDEDNQISNIQYFIKTRFDFFLKYSTVYLFEILYKFFSEFSLKKFETYNHSESIGFGLVIILFSSFIKLMEEKKLYEHSKEFYGCIRIALQYIFFVSNNFSNNINNISNKENSIFFNNLACINFCGIIHKLIWLPLKSEVNNLWDQEGELNMNQAKERFGFASCDDTFLILINFVNNLIIVNCNEKTYKLHKHLGIVFKHWINDEETLSFLIKITFENQLLKFYNFHVTHRLCRKINKTCSFCLFKLFNSKNLNKVVEVIKSHASEINQLLLSNGDSQMIKEKLQLIIHLLNSAEGFQLFSQCFKSVRQYCPLIIDNKLLESNDDEFHIILLKLRLGFISKEMKRMFIEEKSVIAMAIFNDCYIFVNQSLNQAKITSETFNDSLNHRKINLYFKITSKLLDEFKFCINIFSMFEQNMFFVLIERLLSIMEMHLKIRRENPQYNLPKNLINFMILLLTKKCTLLFAVHRGHKEIAEMILNLFNTYISTEISSNPHFLEDVSIKGKDIDMAKLDFNFNFNSNLNSNLNKNLKINYNEKTSIFTRVKVMKIIESYIKIFSKKQWKLYFNQLTLDEINNSIEGYTEIYENLKTQIIYKGLFYYKTEILYESLELILRNIEIEKYRTMIQTIIINSQIPDSIQSVIYESLENFPVRIKNIKKDSTSDELTKLLGLKKRELYHIYKNYYEAKAFIK